MKIELLSEATAEGAQWARISGIPGWESHQCEVLVAYIDGEPRTIGLRLLPRLTDPPKGSTFGDLILSRNRVATFPVQESTRAVAAAMVGGIKKLSKALDALARKPVEAPDPRQVTTAEQVASVYNAARHAGKPPRKTVKDTLGISLRTADRYIERARADGLIPEYDAERKGKR